MFTDRNLQVFPCTSLVFLLEISDLQQQTYVHYLQLDNQEIIESFT